MSELPPVVKLPIMFLVCAIIMRNVLLLTCLLPASILCFGQAPPSQLPLAVKSALDRRFPGWEFIEVGDDIRQFISKRISTNARPELVEGDFDGNGKQDYALLIAHGKVFNDRGKAIRPKVHLVVFLNRRGRYKFYELDEPGEYLTLGRKGADGFNFDADKKFEYTNDAIQVWIFEKAGWVYVYENGKFRYIPTAD